MYEPFDRMWVKASKVLGTPETVATVIAVTDDFLMVICDDDTDWVGPVALDGTVLTDMPGGELVRCE